VIDSSDVARMDIVKKEIEVLLQEEELKGAALLVFANKQDVKGALSEGEIAEKLELAKKCKERYDWDGDEADIRNWSIRACSAVKKEGLTEGLDWYALFIWANLRLVDVINEQHGQK
jgi:ADP-ribosylation factor-like protein 1